jgi:tRNA-(ms[2]io[6]A)-hydroxylase
MLHLAYRTAKEWGTAAVFHIDTILLDHAHLERKAAGTAVTLLFKYSHLEALAEPLSELAREELAHFELVLSHLKQRGIAYRSHRAAPYAGQLRQLVRTKDPEQLLDLLLCSALIEARSCERMQLLAEALTDAPLRELYAGLLRAEARHHRLYIDLAEQIFPRAEVAARLAELAEGEGRIVAEAPTLPRLHNNAP